MRKRLQLLTLLGAAALALCAQPERARAQVGGPYRLTWNTFDGGGAFSAAGPYHVRGTAAQPDAGRLSGGAFTLRGGFWTVGGTPVVGVDPSPPPVPAAFAVLPSAPNPFSTETRISFALPAERYVVVSIYDVGGQRVRTLLNESREAGRHDVLWNGRDDEGRPLANGVYWVRVKAGTEGAARRIVLVH
jgi:hypothetical protein